MILNSTHFEFALAYAPSINVIVMTACWAFRLWFMRRHTIIKPIGRGSFIESIRKAAQRRPFYYVVLKKKLKL